MIKKKSIIGNAFLNAFKTLTSVIFPLITYPYVMQVLHATNLGIVTFSQTIVSYFVLIAALGIGTYAVKEGSQIRQEPEKLNIFCNEMFTINLITTFIAYFLLLISLLFIPKLQQYAIPIIILSPTILFSTIGVDWITVIFEDYLFVTIRSIVVQIINLVLLFLIVKTENDYCMYAFLLALSNGIMFIWNFFHCRRYIKLKVIKHSRFTVHIKSLLAFFVNNLAISVYCYADTTMLGWMEGDVCVGMYAVAVKMYTVIKTILASIYTVCIPRLSCYLGNREYEQFNHLINSIFCSLLLIAIPAIVGLIVLAKPFVLILGGVEYLEAVSTLRILSIALIFAVVGGVLSNCINIPTGRENVTFVGTTVAAVLNIGLNIIFIPRMKQNGAAITTVIAEFMVVIICFVKNRDIQKILNWKEILTSLLHAAMGCVGIIIGHVISVTVTANNILQCTITLCFFVLFYGVALTVLKNKYLLHIFSVVSRKV